MSAIANASDRGTARALPYVLACVLVWALIPDLAPSASERATSPAVFLFLSNVVSVVTLTLVALVKGRRTAFRESPPGLVAALMLLGSVGAFAYYALLYAAYVDADSRPAGLLAIQYTWPVLSAFLAGLVGTERPTFVSRLALVLALLAIVVALWDVQHAPPSAACLRVGGAALLFALYTVGSKHLAYDPYSGVAIMFAGGVLASLAYVMLGTDAGVSSVGLDVLPLILLNGIVVNGVSYAWWQTAIVRTDLTVVAPWVSLTPLLAATYMWLRGTDVGTLHWLGVVLCLAAVLVVESGRSHRAARSAAA